MDYYSVICINAISGNSKKLIIMAYYNNIETFSVAKLNKYLNRANLAVKSKHIELEESISDGDSLHENSCYKVIDILSTQIVELEKELDKR